MEQTLSVLVANEVYDEMPKKKPSNTSLKPENQNHLGSNMIHCVSTKRDWPENLRRETNTEIGETGRYECSSSGCAPPEDSETAEHMNLDLGSSQYRVRKGSWNYFYYLDSDSGVRNLNTEVVDQEEEQHLRVGKEGKTIYHDQNKGKKTLLSDKFHETKSMLRNSEACRGHNRKLGIKEHGNRDCTNETCTDALIQCVNERTVNLKKWIASSDRKVNKAENLYIFKQIVELVDSAHAEGVVLLDLQPSFFILFPSGKVKYIGSSSMERTRTDMNFSFTKKRAAEDGVAALHCPSTKQQKISQETRTVQHQSSSTDISGFKSETFKENDSYAISHSGIKAKQSMILSPQMEELYSSPEELNCKACTFSSNMYSLGVLFFELLCETESAEVNAAIMANLHDRILPPKFLSQNLWESGFCLWLLHPEPSSRPTARMILQSDLLRGIDELNPVVNASISDDYIDETEQLLCFLESLKDSKQNQASKVAEELKFLETDINEVQRRYFVDMQSISLQGQSEIPSLRVKDFLIKDQANETVRKSSERTNIDEARWKQNIGTVEDAYFSIRSQILLPERNDGPHNGIHIPSGRDNSNCQIPNVNSRPSSSTQESVDALGSFYEGLCKFARYRKFEVLGTIRNADLLNSANVICSLGFDRDEEYIAAAGISKKIKIFEFSSISNDSVDVHYPIVEMANKSKISCVCWNNYIQSYLASTDYDGVVQMWDANTGQGFSQYTEHQKRAWSIDFCHANPTMFASGSDDCSVKLWSIKERSSLGTIWGPANVCCVQFSSYSKNLLVFGSADYKIYGYDMRHTRIPWCTLSGHEKAVSYVKFLDAETLVSASTDNSLKLWNLNRATSPEEPTGACGLTFRGHSNEKNFVGLSIFDGYIACGSETNEVYCYSRSLPVPITSHKFGAVDPISGIDESDSNGQFVSSICWRQKCNTIVAANSSGVIKLLQMV